MAIEPTTVFRALSEDTRLIIAALLLKHGELCGCEFESVLDITQSKTSRHLRYLLNSGLLQDRRVGVSIYYRIADDLPAVAHEMLRSAVAMLKDTRLTSYSAKLLAFQEQRCSLPARTKLPPKTVSAAGGRS